MADVDMDRIKRNVKKMVSMSAPEADIDGYIASEGVTIDQVRSYGLQVAPEPAPSRGNITDSILQGVTAGASDEIIAGLRSPFIRQEGESIGDAYSRDLAEQRADLAGYRERRPVASTVAEIGGAIAPALIGVGALPAASNGLARIAAASAAGAVGGGVQGFNSGEGGAGARLESAATGAGYGAATGGVLGGAVEAGAPLVRAGRNVIGFGNSKANANRAVSARLEDDGIDPTGIANMGVDGKPVTLADVGGRQTERLAGRAYRYGDEEPERIRDFLMTRSEGQYDRLKGDLEGAVGVDGGDFRAARESLTSTRADEAKRYREDAYAGGAPGLGEELQAVLSRSPTMQNAFAKAERRMADRGGQFKTENTSRVMDEGLEEAKAIRLEQDEARALVARVNELQRQTGRFLKRPVSAEMKRRGGIDPLGKLAAELRHGGITPKTAPGLFKRGGIKNADNLPADEIAETLGVDLAGDGAGYVDQEAIIAAIVEEARGAPVRASVDDAAVRELDDLLPLYDDAFEIAKSPLVDTAPRVDVTPGRETVEGLHLVRMELDDMISTAEKNSPSRVPELSELRAVVDRQLKSSPEMKRFDLAYASDSEVLDQFDAGRKFMRGDSENTAAAVTDMNARQYEAFRLGVAREMIEQMGRKADTADASAVFNRPGFREKLRAVFKNEDDFEAMLDRVRVEQRMQRTKNDVLAGSQTAERQAADAQPLPVNRVLSSLREASNMRFGNAIGDLAQAGVDRLSGASNARTNDEIARLVLRPDLPGVSRDLLMQAVADKKAKRAQARAMLMGGYGAGAASGTQDR